MNNIQTFNVYCDESCHLEHDHIPTMAWGAVYCPVRETRAISKSVRALKARHGLATNFEAKWTKISPGKVDFYLELTDLFLTNKELQFRGLVVPDKKLLDHRRFEQSHDDWYYKMYFTMLSKIFSTKNRYRVYLDIKDTRGGPRMRKLHEVLANKLHDFKHQCIERVEQLRSHESELLQVTDLLVGALTYANRDFGNNTAKAIIIKQLQENLGENALSETSFWTAAKFNILVWQVA